MRPLPNDLAQGVLRLLQKHIAPHLSGQAAVLAARAAAILRDTDWNRAYTIAQAETGLLDRALARLDLAFPPTDTDDMEGLSARIAGQRAAIAQAIAAHAAAGSGAALRCGLAEVLADCAALGLGQRSAPDKGAGDNRE